MMEKAEFKISMPPWKSHPRLFNQNIKLTFMETPKPSEEFSGFPANVANMWRTHQGIFIKDLLKDLLSANMTH